MELIQTIVPKVNGNILHYNASPSTISKHTKIEFMREKICCLRDHSQDLTYDVCKLIVQFATHSKWNETWYIDVRYNSYLSHILEIPSKHITVARMPNYNPIVVSCVDHKFKQGCPHQLDYPHTYIIKPRQFIKRATRTLGDLIGIYKTCDVCSKRRRTDELHRPIGSISLKSISFDGIITLVMLSAYAQIIILS